MLFLLCRFFNECLRILAAVPNGCYDHFLGSQIDIVNDFVSALYDQGAIRIRLFT